MTVADTGSGQSVWVNRHRLPARREVEARSNNIITLAIREIAFQVVPLSGADSVQWNVEVAQRMRQLLRNDSGDIRFEERMGRKDVPQWVQVSLGWLHAVHVYCAVARFGCTEASLFHSPCLPICATSARRKEQEQEQEQLRRLHPATHACC